MLPSSGRFETDWLMSRLAVVAAMFWRTAVAGSASAQS